MQHAVSTKQRVISIAVALLLAIGIVAWVNPAPAEAASLSCPNGQVRISSNMTSGTNRAHYWTTPTTYNSQYFSGTGWKYSFTGVSYVSNYWYSANGTVSYFAAVCIGF
jgi:hypothetical protein